MPIIFPVDAGRVSRKKRDRICKIFFGNVLHDFGKKNTLGLFGLIVWFYVLDFVSSSYIKNKDFS